MSYYYKFTVIYIYIYVRLFLQISASLHDNAKLARVGVARAAPAHGLTELFLIKYFALLTVIVLRLMLMIFIVSSCGILKV